MSEIELVIERMRALHQDLSAVAGVRLAGATDEQLCAFTVAAEEVGRLADAARIAAAGSSATAPHRGSGMTVWRSGSGTAGRCCCWRH